MSVRLGLILSSNIDTAQLTYLRQKYDLGLIPMNNFCIARQLSGDESFFQASQSECDDLTGIGAFDLYTKDLTPLKSTITDQSLLESVISEYQDRCKSYKRDVIRWMHIMRDLKNNLEIHKVAIFWHVCTTSFEEETFQFCQEERCDLDAVNDEILMKLPQNTLLYFE